MFGMMGWGERYQKLTVYNEIKESIVEFYQNNPDHHLSMESHFLLCVLLT